MLDPALWLYVTKYTGSMQSMYLYAYLFRSNEHSFLSFASNVSQLPEIDRQV